MRYKVDYANPFMRPSEGEEVVDAADYDAVVAERDAQLETNVRVQAALTKLEASVARLDDTLSDLRAERDMLAAGNT